MRIFLLLFLISTFSTAAFAQTQVQDLKQQAATLLEQGKLSELVEVGEKIAKLEKPSGEAAYLTALMHLAYWKRLRLTGREPSTLYSLDKNEEEISEIKRVYQEVIRLATKTKDTSTLSTAYLELGRFYLGPHTRVEEKDIEEVLLKAVELRDSPAGNENHATMVAIGELARFYFQVGDLEKYYPLAVRYTTKLESKSDPQKKELLPYLKIWADFLATIDRGVEAKEFASKIAGVQGSPYTPNAGRSVSRRGDPWPDRIFGNNRPSSSELDDRKREREKIKKAQQKRQGSSDVDDETKKVYSRSPVGIPVGRVSVRDKLEVEDNPNFTRQNVYVRVLIDESGKVIEAIPQSRVAVDSKFMDEIRARALTWKFKPFVLDGRPQRLRATVSVFVHE